MSCDPEVPHLYRVPKWRWWGVRLINGRKVFHRDGWFMRWLINGDWYYRDALPSEVRKAMRADLAKRLVEINR